MVETLSRRLIEQDRNSARRAIRRELEHRKYYHDDTEYAFKMSVIAAMRDRPREALPVIESELQQMHDKLVWHGVHLRDLTKQQRRAIIRSSMFLKDKYMASGMFEKFKVKSFALMNTAVLSLFSTGSTTGLVTECG
jgi:c-di-GMP-binding flagellar brake protein YcgR